jgi:hypothetical protein
MVQVQALVDYEKFRCANVAIFIDATAAERARELLAVHGEAITRLAGQFAARVLLVEEQRLRPERIIENDLADAWILLHSAGRNRATATRKNPQRINVDTRSGWEEQAFKEILRQIQETTRILEDVTSYYSRYYLPEKAVAASLGRTTN